MVHESNLEFSEEEEEEQNNAKYRTSSNSDGYVEYFINDPM
jgi:hypothetical protein